MNNEFYKIRSNLLFSDEITKSLSIDERQVFFYISNLPQKAFDAARKGMLNTSYDSFCIAEALMEKQEKNNLLHNILMDDYLPKKSYYYFRIGRTDLAEQLLQKSFMVSKHLEKNGFQFLIFGRVQQYHNLARIYFSKGLIDEAIETVSEVIVFLLSGYSSKLPEMNINDDTHAKKPLHENEYTTLRYLFICQLLFETIEVMLKFRNADLNYPFIEKLNALFNPVLSKVEHYVCSTSEERDLKEWLQLFHHYSTAEMALFQKSVLAYTSKNGTISERAIKILENLACAIN